MNVIAFHNLLRWAVLLFGLWTVLNAASGHFSKRNFSRQDNLSNLFFMISCDIQLLLGIILLVQNGWLSQFGEGMGTVMKNPVSRFFTVEHAFIMIISWVLVHVGRSSVKRASSDALKHKRMLIYFGIAMLLILVSIPWPFREAVGRSLFPQF